MPRPGGPFEVGSHRVHDEGGAALHLLGAGEDELAGNRVALLRHGGGPAAAGREGLEYLAHLGRGQQHHVGRDLGERAGDEREEGQRLGDGVARRVPGDDGPGEAELLHQRVGDLQPAPVQRGERAGRAGELAREHARAELVEPLQMPLDGRQPDRRLVAEGDRKRVLEMRAPGHRRVPVLSGKACKAAPDSDEVRLNQVERVADLEYDARVLDVLRGRAPMDIAPRIPLADGGKAVDQRHDGVADPVHLLTHEVHVEQVRIRLGRNLGRRRLRDDAEPPLDPRQRRFDVQPLLHLAALGEHGPHGVRAEEVPVDSAVDDGDWHRPALPPLPPARAA